MRIKQITLFGYHTSEAFRMQEFTTPTAKVTERHLFNSLAAIDFETPESAQAAADDAFAAFRDLAGSEHFPPTVIVDLEFSHWRA